MIKENAAKQSWGYSEFSMAIQGFFYRSDQFPLARHNIPSVWLFTSERFVSGKNHLADFFAGGNYHSVEDEYEPNWTLESLKQTAKLAVLLIEKLSQQFEPPRWKSRLAFSTENNRFLSCRQVENLFK